MEIAFQPLISVVIVSLLFSVEEAVQMYLEIVIVLEKVVSSLTNL